LGDSFGDVQQFTLGPTPSAPDSIDHLEQFHLPDDYDESD